MPIYSVTPASPTDVTADTYNDRAEALALHMFGFEHLTAFAQAALIGHSLATGEIWVCITHETTVAKAHEVVADAARMAESWGVEK